MQQKKEEKQQGEEQGHYFIDGWGIVPTDTIQFEGSLIKYPIASIDYDNDTIVLESSATWSDGQGIALSYAGSKPDFGVYERMFIYETKFGTIETNSISENIIPFLYGEWCNPCSLYISVDSASGSNGERDTLFGNYGETDTLIVKTITAE